MSEGFYNMPDWERNINLNASYSIREGRITLEYAHIGRREFAVIVMNQEVNGVPEQIILHPENTTICVFDEGDGLYDHIEYCAGGERLAINSLEIMDLLMDMDFPYHSRPVPDYDTFMWAEACKRAEMHQELGKFLYELEDGN